MLKRAWLAGVVAGVATIACVTSAVAGHASAGEVVPVNPVSPPFDDAKVECNYVSRGAPGAADNELRISASRGFLAIIHLSDKSGKLQVRGAGRCKGRAEPRLDNIDSISINFERPRFGFVSIDMERSALGPGATREEDGSSEIEISVSKSRGSADLSLGGGDDDVTGELTGDDSVGVNLTAGVDTDLDVRGSTRSGITIGLGDGDDTYSEPAVPRGGPLGRPSIVGFVSGDAGSDLLEGTQNLDFFSGGSGGDTISGGPGFDYIDGGEDDDLIAGQGGGDWIEAVGGRDDIEGNGGEDIFFAYDKRRDQIDCGEGEDIAFADRKRDRFDGCERIRSGSKFGGGVIVPRRAQAVERARAYFERSG